MGPHHQSGPAGDVSLVVLHWWILLVLHWWVLLDLRWGTLLCFMLAVVLPLFLFQAQSCLKVGKSRQSPGTSTGPTFSG